jgi:hypothetical protein
MRTRAVLMLTSCVMVVFAASGSQAAVNPGEVSQALQSMPLANYDKGPAMFAQAMARLAPDVGVKFLNKDYENDVYVREPVTGKKVRVSCLRFKADSGFRFAMDPPQYNLTTQQLTITANIAKIRADGLAVKVMVGPCAWTGAGLGVQLTDVKLVYKARPLLTFDGNGACKLSWNNDPNGITIAIGDLNIIGVQNDLDKLAKDATREALNFALDAMFGSALRGELQKIVVNTCGTRRR